MILGTRLKDAASGYEGFHSASLKRIFAQFPADTWLAAVIGPFHMYQTEMRAYISHLGIQYVELPITYGKEKIGKPLSLLYLMSAFKCLYLLWHKLHLLRARK